MTIRVAYFAGCPNALPALRTVEGVVAELAPILVDEVVVEFREVRDPEEAEELRFLGSPSVQIDGEDIEVARRGDAPAFACRIYRSGAGASPTPPREMVAEAIRGAAGGSRPRR